MFEAEIQSALTLIRARTIGVRRSIVLREIFDADIPRSIKSYLQSEVADWLWSESRSLPHFQHLQLSDAAASRVARSLFSTFALEYQFDHTTFGNALSDAVHLTANYICRPRTVMMQNLFAQSDTITEEDLHRRLERFGYYHYLGKLILGHFDRRKIRQMDKRGFQQLIDRIDDRVVKQHSAEELALLAKPIFEFHAFAHDRKKKSVPIEPLLAFYDDKKLYVLKEYIERICAIRQNTELTINELAAIACDLYTDEKLAQGEAFPDGESARPVNEVDDREQLVNKTQEASPKIDAHAVEPAVQRSSTSNLPKLQKLISEEQRDRFIKKVFQKDQHFYDSIIDSLNQTKSWKEASINLHQLYETNGLDPFEKAIVEFTDVVYRRFAPMKETR